MFQLVLAKAVWNRSFFPIGLYLVTPIKAQREGFMGWVTAGSVKSGQAASVTGSWDTQSAQGPPSGGSPAPPAPAGWRRGGIPGDAGVMVKGEAMFSVPEFYSRRRQYVGQSSSRLDVSAAWPHAPGPGDQRAVLTRTHPRRGGRCSRHRGSPAGLCREARAALGVLVQFSALGLLSRRVDAFVWYLQFSRTVEPICPQTQK